MTAKRVTQIVIEKAKRRPDKAKDEIPLGGGLYLRISASGAKSYGCRFRFHGGQRNLSLGTVEAVTLADAKAKAATALAQVAKGTDPTAVKREAKEVARQKAVAESGDTVERLFDLYFAEHCQKKTRENSWRAVQGTFRREAIPRWGKRLVSTITRKDVKELLRHIAKDRPAMANRAQAHLSRFFRWLANEDYITGSPCIGIDRPAQENARERSLTDDEVRRFWAATETLPKPFGDIYKLLLLSAARLQEIAGMEWREVDIPNGIWKLPAARSKSTKPHMLPLGPKAWAIIDAQPRISERYVFGWVRKGFSKMKPKLDAAMGVSDWRNHDLRRTSRSLLSRAHIDSDVAEFMLGHLLTGMRKVYDTHTYFHEKRDGFAKLEHHIKLILDPPSDNVVPLSTKITTQTG